jgi:hypothetical protein
MDKIITNILVKKNILSVKVATKFTFAKGRSRSFLDINGSFWTKN